MARTRRFDHSVGLGAIGDYRVIVRRDSKRLESFVQIMDDSDGVGMGFSIREAKFVIEKLQRGVAMLEEEKARMTRASSGGQMPENDQMPPMPSEQQAVDELNRQQAEKAGESVSDQADGASQDAAEQPDEKAPASA